MTTENNYGRVNSQITQYPQRLDYTDGARSSYCGTNSSGDPTADGTQRAIVIHVKGNDKDGIGSLDDMKKALEYAHPNSAAYKSAGSAGYALSESNKSLFKSEVQKGRYMMVGFGKINTKGKYVGHVVVITDYDPATKKYTLYDPWKGTPATTIGDDIFSYSNTLAGSNGYRLEYFFYTA